MKTHLIAPGGLALALSLSTSWAAALTLDLASAQSPLTNVSSSRDGGNSWQHHGAGAFGGTLDGKPFVTYSVELDQALSWHPVEYTLSRFSAADQNMLDRLYTVADGKVSDLASGVAFQLAVWEIIHESTDTFQLGYGMTDSGHFIAANLLQAHAGAYGTAQLWLEQARALQASDISWRTRRLANANYQDYVLASPVAAVPEPASYAMLLAGLGLVSVLARRRT